MDERMLKTGTVPVADQITRLPAAANGESEFMHHVSMSFWIITNHDFHPVKGKAKQTEEEDEEAELEKLRAEMAMG